MYIKKGEEVEKGIAYLNEQSIYFFKNIKKNENWETKKLLV